MKIRSLNGKEGNWDLRESKYPVKTKETCKSKIQYACGQLIRKRFPLDMILEDVYVPVERIYLDFYLPNRKLAFEVQGQQHGKYIPFFHNSQQDFRESIQRDERKAKWCEINKIELVTVDSTEQLIEYLE